jgi:hypothetical protein
MYVLNGDMPIYKLDILVEKVKGQLKNEGLWKEPFSAYIDNWLKGQERVEWAVNIGGTIFGIGMAVAAFFTAGVTAVILGVAGGVAGLGVAGYNFEMAEDVVDAARSGKGGSEQLVNEESAEANYLFATINLLLSVVDLALAAKKATELVELMRLNKAKLGIKAGEEVLEESVNISKTSNVDRLTELSKDPQTGQVNPKSISEAQTILQAEEEGLVKNPRRPNLSKGEPNLDFAVENGYADIKTPIRPQYRLLEVQAIDIATKTKLYSSDVKVIIDLKNLSPIEKVSFKNLLINEGVNMETIEFINN